MRGTTEQNDLGTRRSNPQWIPAVAGFTLGLAAFGLVQCAPATVNTSPPPVTASDPKVGELIKWADGMYQWAVHIQDLHLCPGCEPNHTAVELSQGDHIRPPPPPQ